MYVISGAWCVDWRTLREACFCNKNCAPLKWFAHSNCVPCQEPAGQMKGSIQESFLQYYHEIIPAIKFRLPQSLQKHFSVNTDKHPVKVRLSNFASLSTGLLDDRHRVWNQTACLKFYMLLYASWKFFFKAPTFIWANDKNTSYIILVECSKSFACLI